MFPVTTVLYLKCTGEIPACYFTHLHFKVSSFISLCSEANFFKQKLAKVASSHKDNETNDNFYEKVEFLIRKRLILGLKAEMQLRTKNRIEDWVLCSYPRDNGHVSLWPKILSL